MSMSRRAGSSWRLRKACERSAVVVSTPPATTRNRISTMRWSGSGSPSISASTRYVIKSSFGRSTSLGHLLLEVREHAPDAFHGMEVALGTWRRVHDLVHRLGVVPPLLEWEPDELQGKDRRDRVREVEDEVRFAGLDHRVDAGGRHLLEEGFPLLQRRRRKRRVQELAVGEELRGVQLDGHRPCVGARDHDAAVAVRRALYVVLGGERGVVARDACDLVVAADDPAAAIVEGSRPPGIDDEGRRRSPPIVRRTRASGGRTRTRRADPALSSNPLAPSRASNLS